MAKDRVIERQDPMVNGNAVTPSDDTNLAYATRGLLVGVAGDVKVTFLGQAGGGEDVVLGNLAAGVIHRIQVTRVWATGTAATGIVAMR